MMPAQCPLTSSVVLLVLLGTAGAGPFSPRSNVTLPAPRPPPKPGGRTVGAGGGNPSQLYEHTVEGGEKQVVFTHRINLPPSAGCGCPPGTEPPVPASEVQALRVRLEILEELVKGLKEHCTGGCCPAAAQAGTGQTDVRSLCSLHGVFDLSRCACSCEPGWSGPTCSEPAETRVPTSSPAAASASCPDDCNDQGRCVRGRCVCFPGYAGPSCGWPSCPGDCHGRGRCLQGVCVCRAGFAGPDCSQRSCPAGCHQRGRCEDGRCVCDPGYAGEDCGAAQELGRASRRGTEAIVIVREMPAIESMRLHLLEETTVRTEWTRAPGPVDAYEIQFIPTTEGVSPPFTARVPSSASAYDQRGLAPGQDYQVTVRALRGTSWGPPTSKTITTMIDGPQDLRVVAVTPTTLELSWLRPQAEVDRFVVSYVSAGNQRVRLEVPPEADGTLLTDLMPGVEYVVTVTAERGRAVSYPASVRANTAPGHYSYPEVRPPALPPKPRPRPARPPRPLGYAEEGEEEEPRPGWSPPQSPGRPRGNLTAELSRFRGSVQDLERHLRARGYPLRANQTYALPVSGTPPKAQCLLKPPSPQGPGIILWILTENLVLGSFGVYLGYDMGSQAPPGHVQALVGLAFDQQAEVIPPATEPPLEPRLGDLTVTDVTPSSVSLSWTVPEGQFDSFMVQYKDRDGQLQEVPVAGDELEVTVPNLEPARKYKMNVYGLHGRQRAGPLSVVAVTDPLPPAPISKALVEPRLGELTVTDVTTDSVGLSWTVPEGEFDSFLVQYKDRDGQPQVVPVAADQREVTVSNLEPSRKYKFLLFGMWDGRRRSPVSVETKTAAQDDASPPRLGELWVTDTTTDSLRLSWTVPEGQFDSFVVQFKGKDGPQVVPVEGHERSATMAPLDSGRKYKFLLYGLLGKKRFGPLTADGTTETPDAYDHTRTKQPPKPQLGEELQVTSVTQDSVSLSWTVPEGQFDSFVVQYKDSDGQPQVVPVEGSLREVSVSGLDPARRYKLLLYGLYNNKRVGPLSAIATTDSREKYEAETKVPSPPVAVPRLGQLTVEEAMPDSLHLSWMVPEGQFDSFEVQYTDRDGQLQVVSIEGDQTDITLTDLESEHRYLVTLYGFHDGKRVGPVQIEAVTVSQSEEEEEPSEAPTTTVQPPPKPRLGELTVTDATPDSLGLSWTVPEGQFDHFLLQYRNGDGQPKVVRVPGHEDQVTISGLEPDHKYKMNLYGFHSGQRVGPVSAIGVTVTEEETPSPTEPSTEAPEPPEEPLLGELTVTGSSPDSLSLSWTIPQGHFDSFTVQYKDSDGRPQVVRVGGQEREATVENLEPGRKYKMHLYGIYQGQRMGPVSTVATTGSSPSLVGATTDEPPPSGPSTTQGAEAPIVLQSLQELGELRVLGKDETGQLRVAWTAQPDIFAHFQLNLQVPEGPGAHEELLPGDVRQALVPPPPPGAPYTLLLHGILPGGKPSVPITYQGIMDRAEEKPRKSPGPPRLGELTALDMASDSLRLHWTVPEGEFDSFLIQYKDKHGPQVIPVEGPQRSAPITSLEPGRKYKFVLYGLVGKKRHGPLVTEAKILPHSEPSPGTPPRLGNLWVTDPTPDSLRLSWTVPEGQFDSFMVQYRDKDGQPQVIPVEGPERSVVVSPLDPDHKYRFTLFGIANKKRYGPLTADGTTAPEMVKEPPRSEILEQPPRSEILEQPLLGELMVTDVTPDSLHLSWTVAQGPFDSFTVQYKDAQGQPQAVPVRGDENEVTVPGLESNRKYKMNLYGLRGRQRVGPVSVVAKTAPEEISSPTEVDESPSPTEPSTEASEPPREPRLGELTVTDATPDSLSLSWTVPEGQFDHFLVQYRNGDGQPKVVRVPGHEDQVTISGLEPDHKYKMNLYGFHSGQRVGPVSAIGVTATEEETPSPTEPSTEAPEPPVEPLLGELTVTGSSPDSLSLSWTVPQGHFDSFTVQYKDSDGRPQVVRVGGQEREATVENLEPGRKYKMHLYGIYQGRRVGPVSTVATTEEQAVSTQAVPTTTPESPPKPRLGELTVTDATPDSLSLSWTVPEGQFDHFLLQYRNGDGQPKVVRVPGHEDQVTISGLEPDHKYKMNLYGFHSGQRTGPVSAIGVTATEEETPSPTEPSTEAPEPPEEPRLGELTVTGSSPDSLSLSWTVPQGHFDSFAVQYKEHQVVSTQAVPTTTPEPPRKPRLGELTVTDATPDSLGLSWTVPEGQFDHFLLQYRNGDGQPKVVRVPGHEDQYKDSDGRPQVVRVEAEEREATIGDLEPGRKYKMHLYGVHQGQRVGPVSTVGVTASLPTQPPVEPRLGELAVAEVTSDTVRLYWTVAQGLFDSFLVQYKDAHGQPQTVPVSRDLREATISGLDPSRKYKFLLFGLQDGKRRGPISVEAKTMPDTKPSPRLGELTVTDVTTDSVGLSWTVPEGEFDSFLVQYKDRDGQPQVVPVAADQREVTVPSLEPHRKYKFLLYGLAGRKRLGPISAEGTTAPLEKTPQPPPRLGELAVTEETPDSLRLSWTVAQGLFDSFLIQYRDRDGQPQAVPVTADQREVTVQGLEPGRKYKFLLYGLSGGKRLGPVSALGVTAPEEAMPTPEGSEPSEAPRLGLLTVTKATPDSLGLEWSVTQGPFDSFVVQYQDTDRQTQALLVDGDQNQVLISGLEPSTSYKFFLYGLHEGKRQGPISAEGITGSAPAGQTPGDPGPRLSQLSVTDVTTISLRLNWEAPLGAFDSFLLRFGVPSPRTLEPHPRPLLQRELVVPGTRRTAILRDLRPGTLYSLTLYGLRGPHKADSIQGTARTLSPVLESPRDLQFTEIGETSAQVNWVPPLSRVDSFKVSYQLADGGEPQSVQVDGRAQSQKLQGLIPGARYEVTVVSVRGFEESEPLTGFLTTVPDGPTQLRALNLTEGSALLHWKAPQNPVDAYNVQVSAPGAPSLQASAPGSAVDYPLRDLVTHINYTATVRGLRGPNFTSPASITFTTGLKAPQDLEAKDVTPRTALFTWTEPQVSPTGYLLSFDTPGGQTQEILLPAGVTSHRLLRLYPSTLYNARLQAVWGESLTPPVSTSFTTGGLRVPFPRDCGEEMQNGPSTSRTTTVFLNGNRERPLDVFCDMETDGGGWLVFQRRMNGKTDFWRDWEEYAHGFGNISEEFWLGNEALHSLTQSGDYSMRVDLRTRDEAVFAQYDSFQVDSAAENYRLHLEGYHGTAGDSMSYHSGSVFSARDRDPNNLLISCAVSYRGAWWYRNCHYANLNGLYGSVVDHQGVSWYHWKGFDFSVPFTEMKLRPRSYQPPARGG
ncbi:PREDICTED: tenascin-X [Dipodomys ordii]|uniref:Tenascin-X n=1 Tax=Dipodomys ordii TaxID=10020 RepID=A0A1S3GNE8_DIPOR|nr:PREDICTED: tenascin-X [Dipodomys ordii]